MRRIAVGISLEDPPVDQAEQSGFHITAEETNDSVIESRGSSAALEEHASLDDEAVVALCQRLAPIASEEDDVKDFAVRAKSLAPPLSSNTVSKTFPAEEELLPPAAALEEALGGDLSVVRFMPEGEIKSEVPHMTITFSHPMIALGSVEDVADQGSAGVTIVPQPEGRFRWLGAKTLIFEPEYRFPMSTDFVVTVPKGTKSILGQELQEEVRFTFSTPTLSIVRKIVTEGPTAKLVFVQFDQRIDPEKIFSLIKLSPAAPFRLANSDDDAFFAAEEKHFSGKGLSTSFTYLQTSRSNAPEGRWISLQIQDLQPGTTYNLSLGPQLPSEEGPRKTVETFTHSFSTPNVLTISKSSNGPFYPKDSISFTATNNIDQDLLDDDNPIEFVRVEPPIEDMQVNVYGNSINIQGLTKGNTHYTVTFLKTTVDVFGQHLSEEAVFEINVLAAKSKLYPFRQGFLTLYPTSEDPALLTYSVVSVNVKKIRVVLFQADLERDYIDSSFSGRSRHQISHDGPKTPEKYIKVGKVVKDYWLEVDVPLDQPTEVKIPIAEALEFPDELIGNVIVWIDWEGASEYEHISSWIQVTKIAATATADTDQTFVWVHNLKNGEPVQNASIVSYAQGSRKKNQEIAQVSDEQGLLHFDKIPAGSYSFVRKGNDCVFFEIYDAYDGLPQTLAITFNDRGLYKPKETVSIKGWVRTLSKGIGASRPFPQLSSPKGLVLDAKVNDGRYIEFHSTKVTLSENGSFFLKFDLPDNVNLGDGFVTFSTSDYSVNFNNRFKIQEFRTPEFKSSVSASVDPKITESSTIVTASAKYYAGGALDGAQANWDIRADASYFSPSGYPGFTFSSNSQPSISSSASLSGKTDAEGEHKAKINFFGQSTPPRPATITATCNIVDINNQQISSSTSFIVHPSRLYVGVRLDSTFVIEGQELPLSVVVADVEGKPQFNSKIELEIFQLIQKRKSVQRKSVYQKEIIVPEFHADADDDSKPLGHRIEGIVLETGGSFELITKVRDEKSLLNQASKTFWVSGVVSTPRGPPQVHTQNLELVLDKTVYEVDQTAKIFIQPPFTPCQGVWSLYSASFIERHSFTIAENSTHVIEVPILKEYTPIVRVSVDLVGSQPPLKGPQELVIPASAHGVAAIEISAVRNKLKVVSVPESTKVQPGSETSVSITVRDFEDKPVADSEVVLIVVDEAVLSLTGHSIGDPFDTFLSVMSFQSFNPSRADSRGSLFVLSWDQIALEREEPRVMRRNFMCAGGKNEKMMVSKRCAALDGYMAEPEACFAMSACSSPSLSSREGAVDLMAYKDCAGGCAAPQEDKSPIAVRSNFNPLAIFSPDAKTDAEGKVTINFKMPDNLTSYRVWTIAAKQNLFGRHETSITAQLPLMIRPSAPRFLNFADKAFISVVLQSQTEKELQVKVGFRTNSNLQTQQNHRGFLVNLAPLKRTSLLFPVEAVEVGTARCQWAASSSIGFSDAAEVKFPIWTPCTSEAFATYGEIDNGESKAVIQPVLNPKDKVFAQFGGLEINLSSTTLSSLTDCFLYLWECSFDMVESAASRALSIVALQDVLKSFNVKKLPSNQRMFEMVQNFLENLSKWQYPNGGFGYYPGRNSTSRSYVSTFVGFTLSRVIAKAEANGYSVPKDVVSKLLDYFANSYENDLALDHVTVPIIRDQCLIFAAYVQNELGSSAGVGKAAKIYRERKNEGLSMESLGWLLQTFHGKDAYKEDSASIVRFLANRVNETAETANFITSFSDANLASSAQILVLHSDRKTDGILLDALLVTDPKNPLITKVVKGLLAHKKKGKWHNSQENIFILLALDRFFRVLESTPPDFSGKLWLDDVYLGDHSFKGFSTDVAKFFVPMQHVVHSSSSSDGSSSSSSGEGQAPDLRNLVVFKDGDAGRLYYRLGLTYAPRDLKLKAMSNGFVVERTFKSADPKDPDAVQRQPDGSWKIKKNATVSVKLTLSNSSRRYHAALIDKIAGGFEVMNPALSITGPLPKSEEDPVSSFRGGCVGFRCWIWNPRWYEHQNLRDERVEAFASYLYEGVHKYEYFCRATTLGQFHVPPATAEEVYSPEVFGRSESTFIEIVD